MSHTFAAGILIYQTYLLHGTWNMDSYIYQKDQENVGESTVRPMDPSWVWIVNFHIKLVEANVGRYSSPMEHLGKYTM